MHIQYIHCTIDKDASTKIPLCVPFYEYAILSAVHNRSTEEGTLEVVHIDANKGTDEGREIRVLDEDFDVDEVFSQMLQVYGKGENSKLVRAVYRDEDAFEHAIRRNADGCEADIADGIEVSEAPPIMTQNPPPARKRRKRMLAKGATQKESLRREREDDEGGLRKAPEKKTATKGAFREGAKKPEQATA